MSSYFGEQTQPNDRSKRRRRSFVEHQGMIETVSAERHSQYHPNPLPISSSSQSPTPLPMASQPVYPPRNNYTPRRRGKRKSDSHVVVPPHAMARRLNNKAVQCIHSQQYEEAMAHLFRAMKLSQSGEFLPNSDSYSLGAILKNHFANSSSSLSSVVPRISPADVDERDDMNTTRDNQISDTMDSEFIYSRGIMVPSESQAQHATGRPFHVILSFNLALAHHLSWATRKDTSDNKRMNHIVQLYELAYRLALGIQVDRLEDGISPDCSGLCNMRFTLAIINNLAQIHRALNDDDDHHGVLENLLSHLMVVATVQQHYSSLNSERSNTGRGERNETEARTDSENNLDGFFQNVLPLVLRSNSAGAA